MYVYICSLIGLNVPLQDCNSTTISKLAAVVRKKKSIATHKDKEMEAESTLQHHRVHLGLSQSSFHKT